MLYFCCQLTFLNHSSLTACSLRTRSWGWRPWRTCTAWWRSCPASAPPAWASMPGSSWWTSRGCAASPGAASQAQSGRDNTMSFDEIFISSKLIANLLYKWKAYIGAHSINLCSTQGGCLKSTRTSCTSLIRIFSMPCLGFLPGRFSNFIELDWN